MRVRTRSACVVVAWGILLILVAVGSKGSFRPAQANIRIASNTISTTSQDTLTSRLAAQRDTAAKLAAAHPAQTDAAIQTGAAARPGRATRADAVIWADAAIRAGIATGAGAQTQAGAAIQTDAASRADAGWQATARARAASGGRAGSGRYVVRPGDTLSGIAALLGVRGGWPALYAANRLVIGRDPDVIRPGTALTLPDRMTSARYTVAVGDTLSGIAAALGTRGGWPALYAANRQALGPDPNAIRVGTVLRIPTLESASSSAPGAGRRPSPPSKTPPSSTTPTAAPTSSPTAAPSSTPVRPPASARASTAAGPSAAGALPRWLMIVLLAAGLLIGISFLAEPVLAIARRRRSADGPGVGHPDAAHRDASHPDAARPAAARRDAGRPDIALPATAGPAATPKADPLIDTGAADPRIVLADYDRLVVTASEPDGTVCVLRPPGADPEVILLAARLVLAEDRYEELAGHLGVATHRRRK